MKNPHIVVGENRRCICGCYGDVIYRSRALMCADVIRVLSRLEDQVQAQISPSLDDVEMLITVMKPMIQECE